MLNASSLLHRLYAFFAPVKFAFGKNLKRRHYNAQLAFSTKASLRTGSRFFVPVEFCYSKTYITWA